MTLRAAAVRPPIRLFADEHADAADAVRPGQRAGGIRADEVALDDVAAVGLQRDAAPPNRLMTSPRTIELPPVMRQTRRRQPVAVQLDERRAGVPGCVRAVDDHRLA